MVALRRMCELEHRGLGRTLVGWRETRVDVLRRSKSETYPEQLTYCHSTTGTRIG